MYIYVHYYCYCYCYYIYISLYIYIYIYIGGWGFESNREIGFVSFVRASVRASERSCVCALECVPPPAGLEGTQDLLRRSFSPRVSPQSFARVLRLLAQNPR